MMVLVVFIGGPASLLGLLSTRFRWLWAVIGAAALVLAGEPIVDDAYSDSGHDAAFTAALLAVVLVPAGLGRAIGALLERVTRTGNQRSR